MKLFWIGTATLALSLTATLPAVALSATYSNTLTGAPTFDAPDTRPSSTNPPSLPFIPSETVGSAFAEPPYPYHIQPFFVSQTALYTFTTTAGAETTPGNAPGWFPAIALYQPSFNPVTPLTNVRFSVSQNTASFSQAFDLTANTQYYLMTSTFSLVDGYGVFNNTISGPGASVVTLTEITAVPAPVFSPLPALILAGIRSLRRSQKRIPRSLQTI